MNDKNPLFSVTRSDLEWSYTKGTGAGGQKRNKTSSAVHCTHHPSGAHGYSEASRSQFQNKIDAFKKMAESERFQRWLKLEYQRRTGELFESERRIENELKKVKIEVKIDGRWVEVNEDQLVDDVDQFDFSFLNKTDSD